MAATQVAAILLAVVATDAIQAAVAILLAAVMVLQVKILVLSN